MYRRLKWMCIPCAAYWTLEMLQWLFLANATESWMMLWILMLVPYRLMLWAGPFALSGVVWGFGLAKREWPIWHILVVNVIVLILNIVPHCLTYILFGSWF